jgi:hypothetical protein
MTSPANRLGLDYAAEARRLGPPPTPIIDVHTHIGGEGAAKIYKRAADLFGVKRVYSMTHIEQVDIMREIFGDRIRFIAVPDYRAEDKRHSLGRGYIDRIEQFARKGVRIAKFWAAPRATDYAVEMGDPTLMKLDHPIRIDAMEAARANGMIFMTHVADPDTWFATRYRDASLYGTKREQYEPLEILLERFTLPWIAAHMGGWPEDLEFLAGLLERHGNLYLDASATKWMVRELSKHSRNDLVAFMDRFSGRIMFGSDIVTADEHLHPEKPDGNEMIAKASSPDEAFDLYASRYWALRTLWETSYDGESPIADPDLAMVEPERYTDFDAPRLTGMSLPLDLLRTLYHDAAAALLEPLHGRDASAIERAGRLRKK